MQKSAQNSTLFCLATETGKEKYGIQHQSSYHHRLHRRHRHHRHHINKQMSQAVTQFVQEL